MRKKVLDYYLLNQYVPNGSTYFIMQYFNDYKFEVILSEERKTILGNYSFISGSNKHIITINSNLNKYSFLVTLIHEIAHLITFSKFKNKVHPHGTEWKNIFKAEIIKFIEKKLLPEDVEKQLLISIEKPKASACSDLLLYKVLNRYNDNIIGDDMITIDNIKPGEIFIYEENRVFKMIGKNVKRYKCEELKTSKLYVFYALTIVKQLR